MSPNEWKWAHVKPKWFQVILSEVQPNPSETKWAQGGPGDNDWIQVNLRESNWIQVAPSDPNAAH